MTTVSFLLESAPSRTTSEFLYDLLQKKLRDRNVVYPTKIVCTHLGHDGPASAWLSVFDLNTKTQVKIETDGDFFNAVELSNGTIVAGGDFVVAFNLKSHTSHSKKREFDTYMNVVTQVTDEIVLCDSSKQVVCFNPANTTFTDLLPNKGRLVSGVRLKDRSVFIRVNRTNYVMQVGQDGLSIEAKFKGGCRDGYYDFIEVRPGILIGMNANADMDLIDVKKREVSSFAKTKVQVHAAVLLHNGNIAVALDSNEIVIYSQAGDIIRTIENAVGTTGVVVRLGEVAKNVVVSTRNGNLCYWNVLTGKLISETSVDFDSILCFIK
jgi:hypothetical protein